MTWEFTLKENFYDGRETVIDEPVGWDALSMILQRDPDWHGISPLFSTSNLEFAGEAYWILKDEYERAGIDGSIGIRIRWKCDDCIKYKLFYEGKIDFERYDENCREDCYIVAGIEDDSPQTMLKNRNETDVDLTSNIAYDGVTELTDYAGLNKEIEIPSKAILVESYAKNDDTLVSENLVEDAQWYENVVSPSQMLASIFPGFIKTIYADIATTTFFNTPQLYNGAWESLPGGSVIPIVDFQILSENLQCTTSDAEIEFRYKGSVATDSGSGGVVSPDRVVLFKFPEGADPDDPGSFEILFNETIGSTFDKSYSGTITLTQGDRIWFVHQIFVSDPADWISYVITEDPECYFKLHFTSLCAPTPCNTFMLHEAASRIVENITNNTLKFKSEYFGRIDSEPYAFDNDGCGGLRTLMNGLNLRRAILADGSLPKVFTNWRKLLDSLNACDLIGYDVTGNDVRTEPAQFFYQNIVVFVADGVNAYNKKIRNDRIWNQFNFGYDRYETESTNGLDAIHTKRQYRVPLQNARAILEKLCKYILDGYAEEVTRRKFGTTQDWRYDQDIFMLCLKRGETDVEVEQGNIDDAANMFDPPTVINYRLSPIRNAMRWFKWIMQGIRQIDPDNTQMLFNSGVGNYVGEGKLQGTDCVLEANAIAENDPLFQNQFADVAEATPFIVPEEVTFTFPLGLNEFLFLKQNIYGLVQYRRYEHEAWQFGWITKLEPKHEAGEAIFTLVTALGATPVEAGMDWIITESGLVITNEDGPGWITEN